MSSEFLNTNHLVLTGYNDDGSTLTWNGEQLSQANNKVVDVNSNGVLDVGVDYFGNPAEVYTGYVVNINGNNYGVFGANAFFVPYDASVDDLGAARPLNPKETSTKIAALPLSYLSLFSSDEDDPINGTTGPDTINASAGDDVVSGGDGDDIVDGGPGNDTLLGQGGNDILNGNIGADSLVGGADNDSIEGSEGEDTLDGGPGNDTLKGEEGDDLLIFRASGDPDRFDGGADTDTFRIIPNISGTQDLTQSTFVNLEIYDGAGQSVIINPGQLDQFDLIINIGTIFHDAPGTSDLSNSIGPGEAGGFFGSDGDDVFDMSGADTGWRVEGWTGDDTLIGGEGDDTLNGQVGNDLLQGGGGDDTLIASNGMETLEGGAGDDTFEIHAPGNVTEPANDTFRGGAGRDTITNIIGQVTRLEALSFEGIEVLDVNGVTALPGQLELFTDITRISSLLHVQPGQTDLTGIMRLGPGDGFVFTGSDLGDDTLIARDATYDIQVNGGRGDDVVFTGAGDDLITGTGDNNLFETGGGNDSVDAREGDDTIRGEAGNDTLQGNDGNDLIEGGADDDLLIGFRGQDTLLGGTGQDELNGQAGDDILNGGSGNDTLIGEASGAQGSGNDTLIGGEGDDVARYEGVSAADIQVEQVSQTELRIIAGSSTGSDVVDNTIETFEFADRSFSFAELSVYAPPIDGDETSQTLTGTDRGEQINGLAGFDWIIPGRGNDTVDGGADRDMVSYSDIATDVPGRGGAFMVDLDLGGGTANVFGGEADQLISIERATGSIFADVLRGSDGNDELRGLGDYDWFVATQGQDTLNGGNGLDMVTFVEAQSTGAPVVQNIFATDGVPPTGAEVSGVLLDLTNGSNNTGLAQGQTLESIERVTGSSHQDVFFGDGGQNDFRGLGGFDYFVSSTGGRERYFGGDGVDTVTYFNAGSGVIASLRNGAGEFGGQETGYGSAGDAIRDLYFEIENLVGSDFDDRLEGNRERNDLVGRDGDDYLLGYGNTDYLKGGAGNDTLDGGAGSDFALFDGNRGDYTLTRTSSTEVTIVGADGTDSLINVEYFQFDDQTANIWELSIV